MIFIQNLTSITETKQAIGFAHYNPFDKEKGLGKTQEELLLEGILIPDVPIPEHNGNMPTLFYNPITNKGFYENINTPSTLEEAKTSKLKEINDACQKEICEGFYSSADGTKKLYEFEIENQTNMLGYATSIMLQQSTGTPLTTVSYYAKGEQCHDYTIEQFLQLYREGMTFKTNRIEAYKALKAQVEPCTTIEAVQAISWSKYVW